MGTRTGVTVVGWSKILRPDIQKPCQMENAVRDICAIYGEVNVSVEKCVEIKGDYVEKYRSCFICHLKKLVRKFRIKVY